MNAAGINQGMSGNLSVRIEGGFLVTPSGVAYDAMEPEDIVAMGLDGAETVGRSAAGESAAKPTVRGRRPSSEWRLHRDIYASYAGAGAIVHAHAMFATTLSCLDRMIPAFHYMVAMAGGPNIRCASYATFGTQELADAVVAALADRKACLMSHHGMIAFSDTLASALALAVEVETLSAMYWRALQVGEPTVLPEAEMAIVLEKFKTYSKG
jgi:L-fuculose-phosphate aldolase